MWVYFCSIDPCIYFCASINLLWLLYICDIVWNQGIWYFQLCSFSRLFWSIQDFFGHSIQFFRILCSVVTVVVQSLCHVWLFAKPWTASRQASLAFWCYPCAEAFEFDVVPVVCVCFCFPCLWLDLQETSLSTMSMTFFYVYALFQEFYGFRSHVFKYLFLLS